MELKLYSFFNFGARWWCVANVTPRPLYPWEMDPVPIVWEAKWAPGPVWTDAENLAPVSPLCHDDVIKNLSMLSVA